MKNIYSLLLIIFLLYPVLSQDLSKLKLSKKQWQQLSEKKQILKKKEIEGAPWPEVKVFALIDASPEESTSVYFAFPEHKKYIPGLIRSIPEKYVSPTDIHINFEVNLSWPLANSRFTTGNRLKKLDNGGYQIEWYAVKHSQAKECRGDITFLPYRDSTLLIYRNFTHPDSKLASLFKNKMYKNVKRTIKAIITRIESITGMGKDKMDKYKLNMNKALEGKYIYKNLSGE